MIVSYLTLNIVLALHKRQLQLFGGAEGIRNRAGLESAVEQLKATFGGEDLYPSVFDKASVYAFHIAEAQAFVDGNKRTAMHAALTFLAINNCTIGSSGGDRLFDAMIAISERKMSREELSDLFQALYIETIGK